jgi:hypothetical protein
MRAANETQIEQNDERLAAIEIVRNLSKPNARAVVQPVATL